MKLTAEDYEVLIKAQASHLVPFAQAQGTSLSFDYMRKVCNYLIEISNEYQMEFPKESKRFSDG